MTFTVIDKGTGCEVSRDVVIGAGRKIFCRRKWYKDKSLDLEGVTYGD